MAKSFEELLVEGADVVSEIETEKLYKFILNCYNNGSVSYKNPDREFLGEMCADTDNMHRMQLDTFQFGGVYETIEALTDAVAASMEDGLVNAINRAEEWLDENEEYIGLDENDYQGKMFWTVRIANTWDDDMNYIISIDPEKINWKQLAIDLWGDDIEQYIADIDE